MSFILLCLYSSQYLCIISLFGNFLQVVVITDVTRYFVIVDSESSCDSYDGKVEDISVDKSRSDTSTL
jgi:hypothetical protein